jgi:DNA-binding response OmpR family regulator
LHGAAVCDRAIDVQITRLRSKIATSDQTTRVIRTKRGVGYTFNAEAAVRR